MSAELIDRARNLAPLLDRRRLPACAATMRALADRLEESEALVRELDAKLTEAQR